MVNWLKKNVHPLDLVYKLAEDHAVVLLNGGGFDAPDWSVRVSFANLDDDAYESIGRGIRSVARGYGQAYCASKGLPPLAPVLAPPLAPDRKAPAGKKPGVREPA
jgi:aspartate 4-decarboxylase